MPFDILNRSKKISSIQLNDMTIGSYAPHFLSNGRNFPYFCHSLGKSIAALSQLSQQAEQGKPIHITIKSGVDDIGNITQSLTHIYDNLLKTKEKLSIEQEKLFKHLQFSKEGLAFFSKDKRIIMKD